MYASVSDRTTMLGNTLYLNVWPHLSAMRMCGIRPENVITVDVVEDPDGEYLGWVRTGETELKMVQQTKIFPIQFAYGVKAEVDAGAGEAVQVTIIPVKE